MVRSTLTTEFAALIKYIVFSMWHTTERHCMQPWFLQNLELFLVACTDSILLLNTNDNHTRVFSVEVRRAFRTIIDIAEGAKDYLGIANVESGAHALLLACSVSTTPCFIKNGRAQFGGRMPKEEANNFQFQRNITLAHVLFMDEIAKKILSTSDENVVGWSSAFGYFGGSAPWRAFARRTRLHCRDGEAYCNHVMILERKVEQCFVQARLRILEAEGVDVKRGAQRKKRGRASPTESERDDDELLRRGAQLLASDNNDGCASPGGTLDLERIADIGQTLSALEKRNQMPPWPSERSRAKTRKPTTFPSPVRLQLDVEDEAPISPVASKSPTVFTTPPRENATAGRVAKESKDDANDRLAPFKKLRALMRVSV